MGLVICYNGVSLHVRLRVLTVRAVNSSESSVDSLRSGGLRLQVLQQVDEVLRKGDERGALSLVKDLQGKPGGLRCFGAARQVPQRLYSLDELKLNGIDAASFLSPVDITLGSIERNLQLAAVSGGFAAWLLFGFSQLQMLYLTLGLLLLWTLDLVSFDGGVRNLVLDTIGHNLSQKYHNRVIQHEAGHFLIAYLLGILPKGYTLSSLEALMKEGSLNVQAGTSFVDFEFLDEIDGGKVSAKVMNLRIHTHKQSHAPSHSLCYSVAVIENIYYSYNFRCLVSLTCCIGNLKHKVAVQI